MKRSVFLASFVVLAVAGCSSSSSGGDQTSPPPTTPVTSASASASPSQSPSASPSPSVTPTFPTTVKATHTCRNGDISLSVGQAQGAAGSTIVPLLFENDSHKPCTMYGYPGVSFLDASEQQIGVDAVRTGSEEGVVTLAPGDVANAQIKVPDPGNFSPADCKPQTTTSVRVYLPGETRLIETPLSIPICTTPGGAAMVQPVTPGNGG